MGIIQLIIQLTFNSPTTTYDPNLNRTFVDALEPMLLGPTPRYKGIKPVPGTELSCPGT